MVQTEVEVSDLLPLDWKIPYPEGIRAGKSIDHDQNLGCIDTFDVRIDSPTFDLFGTQFLPDFSD